MATKKIDKKKMACNKPKRTPSHAKKSHVVKACANGKQKIIRFGEQGASTAGKPKAGESAKMKAKRKSSTSLGHSTSCWRIWMECSS